MKENLNGELVIVGRYSTRFLIYGILLIQLFVFQSQSLKILPKPCSNALGEQGTCMFVWECIKTEGRHLGTCVDGFLFGSCCTHNETLNQLDSGGPKSPVKPYYSIGITAAYHSSHDQTPANLDLTRDHSNNDNYNLTSYVNFNNSPPNDNDVYHIHDTSHSSSLLSTNSPHSSATSIAPLSSSSTNYHHLTNNHHPHNYHHSNSHSNSKPTSNGHSEYMTHYFNDFDDNDDHRRPHTHGHNHSNHTGPHSHHHSYENFHHSNKTTTNIKPTVHSFINFNQTNQNHLITNKPISATLSSSKPPIHKPSSFPYHSTTILPTVMNYNPFKPANHSSNSFLSNISIGHKNSSAHLIATNKPAVVHNITFAQSTRPSSTVNSPSSSTWNSFYRPWSSSNNKPSNGQVWSIHTFTAKPSSNSFLQTFRPPLFNIFRPHSSTSTPANNENQSNPPIQSTSSSASTLTNFNSNNNPFYSKPPFRPQLIRPTASSHNSNVHSYYSTRTTPFQTNTPSMTNYQFVTLSSVTSSSTTSTTTEQPFLIGPSASNSSAMIFHEIKPLPSSYQNLTNISYLTNESSSVTVTNGDSKESNSQSQNAASHQTSNNLKVPESRANCGKPKILPNTKVVGGRSSTFGAWPWQVSVRRTSFFGFSSTHRCGGAILSANWIATAAHCIDDLLMSHIRIRVGEYDFASVLEPYPYQERSVKRKVVHPHYNFFTYENDLALVELDEPLVFQPHIAPICLPEENIGSLLGRNATVTGWGRLSEGGVLPSVLQEVRVPIVSNEKCKSMFSNAGRQEYIPDVFLCAGFENGGHDSCQGDSGGPMQVQGEDGRWFLAGIISWGIGCAEKNLPGVCTRINKFVNWINHTMHNHLDHIRY